MRTTIGVTLMCVLTSGLMLGSPTDAQSPPPQRAQTKPVDPGEQAFRDALATKDPAEKLRAFQKLGVDFPNSQAVKSGAVDFNILTLSCLAEATNAKEARRAADAFVAKIPPSDLDKLAFQHFMMASQFMRADSLWADAERHARKSLGYWDARGTKTPPMSSGFPLERAVVATYLGQAIAKQGREDEAVPFLRQAFDGRGDEPGVVNQVVPLLLAHAKRSGRIDQQVEYLVALALYGGLKPELREELEGLYRGSHGGSLDGFEAMLDERYEAEAPMAVAVEPFERTAGADAHVVLTEMFTGASCAPCVGMDLAVEAAMRRYRSCDLVVLVYHAHSPAPDPLVNPSGEARATWYRTGGSAPHVMVDGVEFDAEGGGKAAEAAAIFKMRLQPAIDRAMAAPIGVRIALNVTRTGDVVRAKVALDKMPEGTKPLRLHVALVEERVRFSGGNGIRFHPMVVRNMAGGGAGFEVAAGRATSQEAVFDLSAIQSGLLTYLAECEAGKTWVGPFTFNDKKVDIDATRLLVVAFVQEADTRRVLQSAQVRVAGR